MVRWLITVNLVFLLSGCQWIDNWRARKDLDEICGIVRSFESETDDEKVLDQAVKLASQFEDAIDSHALRKAIVALTSVSPDQRQELLGEVAREVGYNDFHCPELDAFFQPQK